jgi:hypothetical protein
LSTERQERGSTNQWHHHINLTFSGDDGFWLSLAAALGLWRFPVGSPERQLLRQLRRA